MGTAQQARAFLFSIVLAASVFATTAAAQSKNNGQWLTTRTVAAKQLPERFLDVKTATCAPDRTSNTQVFGTTRYWNRFWCTGATYDQLNYRVRYEATGKCAACWTITHLTGLSAPHLRVRHASSTHSSSTGSTTSSGSCGADYYRNSSGHCVLRPTANPPDPAGATALCADGTYSYSEHASGTCSHHGGVARWINHP